MSNLQTVSDTLRAPETLGRMMLTLGFTDPKDEAGKSEARRYAASVLGELEKMAADPKKRDILECTPQSIAQVMIDAAKFRLMIDGRQLAHIVKFGNTATLQIGYRGYIAKITEHFEDADINVFPVYEGDDVHISGEDGYDRYTHARGSVFNNGEEGFQGVIAALSYTKGGRKFQKVITMSKAEVGKIRKVAKQDFVWASWFIEKAKAAAVKRICKLQFASISILQEMISYDNQHNFDVAKPITEVKSGSIVDNLNKILEDRSVGAVDAISGDVVQQLTDQSLIVRQVQEQIAEVNEPGDLEFIWHDLEPTLAAIKENSPGEYAVLQKAREDKMKTFSAMA